MGIGPEILQLLQGGGGGGAPMGAPGAPAPDAAGPGQMDALGLLQQSPAPHGEQEALRDASMKIGLALSRVQMRSPKAARLLSEASAKIQAAREALEAEGSRPLSPPPNLAMLEQGMVPGMTG